MNKTAIKNFSTYSRRKLIESTKDKCKTIGITEDAIESPVSSSDDFEIYNCYGVETTLNKEQIKQRNSLIKEINDKGFNQVVEEVAYTWFNRLIAVRFMEVNDYLPSRQRILSSIEDARIESDLMRSPNESDIDFTSDELSYVYDLKEQNNTNELFKFLFIKECNKLNEYLPELFEKTDDYTELLFNISFDDKDDVVYKLVHDIEESNFDIEQEGQVEIIGWFYQYYISDPKDNLIHAKKQYKDNDVPFVTQLFTPDWIVKFMVQNSLGNYWMKNKPDSTIYKDWEFFMNNNAQNSDDDKNIENITFFDPCMGSGHILVYAFDMFMEMYVEQGYSERNASEMILKNNLYGIDIDKRAYQLTYLSLMMKARQYNRRVLTKNIKPHIVYMQDCNISKDIINFISKDNAEIKDSLNNLNKLTTNAGLYGSIIDIDSSNSRELDNLLTFINERLNEYDNSIFDLSYKDWIKESLIPLVEGLKLLTNKYDIVVTNPPYLSSSLMPKELKSFVIKKYPDVKSDMFAVFIYKCMNFVKDNGYIGMLTPYVWMFISSYEKLRNYVLTNGNISSLVQLEYNAFEAACVPVATFILHKTDEKYEGNYIKLSDFRGSENQAPKTIDAINNHNCGYYYEALTTNFSKIPGSPIAYWISEKLIEDFEIGKPLGEIAISRNGMKTGDNERFLRLWWEISNNKCNFNASNCDEANMSNKKWFPYNKGGKYCKWYGNNDYVVNWQFGGKEIFYNAKSDKRNVQDYPSDLKFSPSGSWGLITSSQPSFRYKEYNLSDIAGMSFYAKKDIVLYLLAFCNTFIANKILQILAPTINYQSGDIAKLPIIFDEDNIDIIEKLVEMNIKNSKQNWDSFETSWDFTVHPLVKNHTAIIKESYNLWNQECDDRFNQLKSNEEELNRIFIDIYGLQDELTPEVDEKDVTVRKADLTRDIKSFISYAVGCMFGRYSLDEEGLVYAGGNFDINRYQIYKADEDNILPICDEEYFDDDIVGRFIDFVRTVYGSDTLEENLNFIADALNTNGSTSREKIRNYFIKDFFKDHCQTYSVTGSGKRPIYWLFDSGKQNGFKALIYMHRYDEDTVGRVRTDYLHKVQSAYEDAIKNDEYIIENSNIKSDINKASKHRDKLLKQLEETRIYDQALAHMANKRISIDLDDGVKHNYALFQGIEVSKEGSKTKKVDLLAKIK
ncbi:MAG: BREX-1 system adenine-specific DNA-methyltransferase PglX [Erysipelotrichaceae bacterium]|nr:BREX-1 system adenine-specific DNA-methyltransferase PglX [Erysipelotrichaceae bacterium]